MTTHDDRSQERRVAREQQTQTIFQTLAAEKEKETYDEPVKAVAEPEKAMTAATVNFMID
jgi:hypothetical protein